MTRRPLLARLVDATRQLVAVAARAALEWTQADARRTQSERTARTPGRAGGPPAHWVELVRDRAPQLLDTDHNLDRGPEPEGPAGDEVDDDAGGSEADHRRAGGENAHAVPPVAWRRAPRPRSERSGAGDREPAASRPGRAGRAGPRRPAHREIAAELRRRWDTRRRRRGEQPQDEPLSDVRGPRRRPAGIDRDGARPLPDESFGPRPASAGKDLTQGRRRDTGGVVVSAGGEAGPSATEQRALARDPSRPSNRPGRRGRPTRSPVRPVEPPAFSRSGSSRVAAGPDQDHDDRIASSSTGRSRDGAVQAGPAERTPGRPTHRTGPAWSISTEAGDDQAPAGMRRTTRPHRSEPTSPRPGTEARSASPWIDLLDPVEPLSVLESPQRERWRTEMDEQ